MDQSVPSNSELLYSFLEGELETSMEPMLFTALHTSADLRSEMRDMLALNRAVRKDRAAIIPPIASTAAVFGALGMSTSMLVNSSWLSALWAKLWIPLAAAIVGSAVTYYAVSPGQNSGTSTPVVATAPATSSSSSSPSVASSASNTNQTVFVHDTIVRIREVPLYVKESQQTTSASDNGNTTLNKRYIVVKELPLNTLPEYESLLSSKPSQKMHEDDRNTNDKNTSLSSNASLASNQSASTTQTQLSIPITKPQDMILNEPMLPLNYAALTVRRVRPENLVAVSPSEAVNGTLISAPMARMPEPFKPGWNAYLRGLSSRSSETVGVAADNSLASNFAIDLGYQFNDVWSTGIAVGFEPYAMKFQGVKDGALRNFEANPTLTWASVNLRASLLPSLSQSGWQIFVQPMIGFTEYGLLPRAIVGATYAPIPSLRMMFGMEASMLRYSVGSNNYNTLNYGFTYGIGIPF